MIRGKAFCAFILSMILTACPSPPTSFTQTTEVKEPANAPAPSAFSLASPPKAERREVKNTYFGQTISDSYRWLEDLKSTETQSWMKAQTDYTRAFLDHLPMHKHFTKRMKELKDVIGTQVVAIQRCGQRYFYERRAPHESDFKIYVREGLDGIERLLVDPDKIGNGEEHYSIDRFSLSQDCRYVSFVSSKSGNERGELRVVETSSGKDIGLVIDRVHPFKSAAWLPDGQSFLYSRLQAAPSNAPLPNPYEKMRIYRHVLGTHSDSDKAVFGYGCNPKINLGPDPLPFIAVPPSSKYMIVEVNSGVSPNSEFYIAPIKALKQNSYAAIEWHQISTLEDEVRNLEIFGDDVYLRTFKNASRYKVVHINLKSPDLKHANVVFSAGESVVESLATARDALYVQTLEGGTSTIYRVDYSTYKAHPIALPYQGSATILAGYADKDGLFFGLETWTKSYTTFLYDPKTNIATNTHLVPPIQFDMSNYDFVNAKAESHDGTMIPIVIIYKKGIKRDSTNPVLMSGYGAYGTINTSPGFSLGEVPWLELGGLIVYAGIRGGGEYGEEWHLGGKGLTKPNTWKDFIACAEYLISEKYTSPAHLGISGASAGGILISNAITTRPDLFGAAVSKVGVNNALLGELSPTGIANISEFGTFTTEEGFRNLLAMDGYYKVKDGVKYPAVLLTHGINDARVEPWMSSKMAARLQAATGSGKPILLRIDYDAGHGSGSTIEQMIADAADLYSFLFQELRAK